MTTTESVEIQILAFVYGGFFTAYLPVSCLYLNAGLN